MCPKCDIYVAVLTAALLTAAALAPSAWADVNPAAFQRIGNERESIIDARTGREVTFLSQPDHVDTLYYPTCRSWSADSRLLLFESTRPRPPGCGTPSKPQGELREIQLMMADVDTGDVYWLAAVEPEDMKPYGDAQKRPYPYYHADYAPGTDSIVYFDLTGHNVYLLSLRTGKTERLFHMTDGTIGPPPSIATDGSRILFYAAHPGPPENDHFLGWTYAIYAQDIDTQTNKPRGKPYPVTAYTARKGPTYEANPRDQITLGHCQLNPADPDRISYCHEYGGSRPDGTIHKARIWVSRIDGRDDRPAVETPVGRWHTHEVWGHRGEWIYYVDTHDLARVHATNGTVEAITTKMWPRASHLDVASDESFVVYDTWNEWGVDEYNENWIGVVKATVPDGKIDILAIQPGGREQPRHTHPNLAPNDKRVGFTVAVGNENARIAIVPVAPATHKPTIPGCLTPPKPKSKPPAKEK
jgi:hypothetical protein